MDLSTLSKARIYVGTYKKYNAGSLYGKWLSLSDFLDTDDFYEECRQIHIDEAEPEFMFQDWENIPKGLISENQIAENIFEICNALQELSVSEQEAFLIWIDDYDLCTLNTNQLVQDFQDQYQGKYISEEDFAYQIIEECYDLNEFLKAYFDYSMFARDLFCCDYWFQDGFVFRRL